MTFFGFTLTQYQAAPPSKPSTPCPLDACKVCHPCYWNRCGDCAGTVTCPTTGQQVPCGCPAVRP